MSTVNYNDLYEDFLLLASASSSSTNPCLENQQQGEFVKPNSFNSQMADQTQVETSTGIVSADFKDTGTNTFISMREEVKCPIIEKIVGGATSIHNSSPSHSHQYALSSMRNNNINNSNNNINQSVGHGQGQTGNSSGTPGGFLMSNNNDELRRLLQAPTRPPYLAHFPTLQQENYGYGQYGNGNSNNYSSQTHFLGQGMVHPNPYPRWNCPPASHSPFLPNFNHQHHMHNPPQPIGIGNHNAPAHHLVHHLPAQHCQPPSYQQQIQLSPPLSPPIIPNPPPAQVTRPVSIRPLWLGSGEPPIYPGGLEVLWREVPKDCQKIIAPQDVPDTARYRGYFTVAELLSLKSTLLLRLKAQQGPYSGQGYLGPLPETVVETTFGVENSNGHNNDNNTKAPAAKRFKRSKNAGRAVATVVKVSLESLDQNSEKHANRKLAKSLGPLKVVSNPYRASTLVFRLLQIGNYQFHSFSPSTPNRFRALFNAQRLTYECFLPPVQSTKDQHQLRKMLTIEISFDQITNIKFMEDAIEFRVNGPPVLTVTYNPVNPMDKPCSPLSPQDEILLDHIHKGQLSLSPVHTVYFLNERLVGLLEGQFREHPRFQSMLCDSATQIQDE